MTPIIRWAGGKVKLLPELLTRMPTGGFKTYYEPFAGGLALLLTLHPDKAVVADTNPELVNFYAVVMNDAYRLMQAVLNLANNAKTYATVRAWDVTKLSQLERATRFLYLNKTCFNGLWRVNSKGQFNVPYGRPTKPHFFDSDNMLAVGEYLTWHVDVSQADFEKLEPEPGDFVYLDPPYLPTTKTSGFTSYTHGGFTLADHKRLSDYCRGLDSRKVKFMLSNSNVSMAHELYTGFNIDVVGSRQSIGAKSVSRKPVGEVIVRNYT